MKILLVFAHPDDESFTCGGTIIKYVAEGNEVNLICATKGEAGMLGDPPLCTKEEIVEVREKELRDASKVLGINKIYFLEYLDGKLKDVDPGEIYLKILNILRKEEPDMVITFDKNGMSNHPDHIAISQATYESFENYMKTVTKKVSLYCPVAMQSDLDVLEKANLEYNAFGKTKGVEMGSSITRVDISKELEQKIKALRMHKTQKKDWERVIKTKDIVDLNTEYLELVLQN